MRRLPSILASGAAAIVLLASATALAQQGLGQGQGDAFTEAMKAREAYARARPQSLRAMANQLRPFYRYELMHARTACGLTKEQLRKIRPEADTAYEEAIDGLYTASVEGRKWYSGVETDYHGAIRRAVFSVVERHVSREQWAALQADLRARAVGRKEAGVPLLVAMLDRELLLTEPQRQQIAESLSAHWDDRWCDALEAAFAQQSRCPEVPDPLVAPYLSEAQQDTWRRVPRIGGRLWGVAIDHGGDPAMEQELGGDGKSSRTPTRPRIRFDPAPAPVAGRLVEAQVGVAPPAVVRQPAVVARQPVVVRQPAVVVRQPAVVAQPAPIQDGDDDPDEDGDTKLLRQRQVQAEQAAHMRLQLQAAYSQLFERRTFGGSQGEDETRREVETALAKRVDHLEHAGRLADRQAKKLQAAGHGDIKRFFDGVADARQRIRTIEDRRALAQEVARLTSSLAEEKAALQEVAGPIFTKAVARTLTDDQRAALEQDARDRLAFRHRADVRWTAVILARSLGLVDDRRRRLESLLIELTRPPNKFGIMDYMIVMYQTSRIPEDKIRPIFDDVQWRVMTQEFAAARGWAIQLKKGGFLPDEMFGDGQDGALPPIHLLDPPSIRR
jgi:hypothetical protein